MNTLKTLAQTYERARVHAAEAAAKATRSADEVTRYDALYNAAKRQAVTAKVEALRALHAKEIAAQALWAAVIASADKTESYDPEKHAACYP